MADRPKTLSAAFVKSVREAGRYGDGRGGYGLSLLVKPTTTGRLSKSWSQRLYINGRPAMLGLGAYPVVTLGEARALALENRRQLSQGIDPRTGGVPTFAEAAERVLSLHAEGWRDGGRTAAIWRSSLERYAHPAFGRKSVADVTAGDILAVVSPLWTAKRATARKLKNRVGAVMAWSVAQGYRADDPTAAVTAALPRNGNTVQHQRALSHGQVAAALATIRDSGAPASAVLAFRFLTLTAARSGEVRGARWAEVDREAAVWTIPSTRTKTGRPHRVPLSAEALAVLTEAEATADGSGLIFSSPTGRVLSDGALSRMVRENGVACVPHGMRSTFRDWAGETGVAREVAEACLAHVVRGVEGAYARSDLLERRRPVMAAWGVYCAS